MTTTFNFPGKSKNENFQLGTAAQTLVDNHMKQRVEILESEMPRTEKKAALMAHDAKLQWSDNAEGTTLTIETV